MSVDYTWLHVRSSESPGPQLSWRGLCLNWVYVMSCWGCRLCRNPCVVGVSSAESVLLPEPTVRTMVAALRSAELAVLLHHQERAQRGSAEHAGREASRYEQPTFHSSAERNVGRCWLTVSPLPPLCDRWKRVKLSWLFKLLCVLAESHASLAKHCRPDKRLK